MCSGFSYNDLEGLVYPPLSQVLPAGTNPTSLLGLPAKLQTNSVLYNSSAPHQTPCNMDVEVYMRLTRPVNYHVIVVLLAKLFYGPLVFRDDHRSEFICQSESVFCRIVLANGRV